MARALKVYYTFSQTGHKTTIKLYTSSGKLMSKGFPFDSFESAEAFLSGWTEAKGNGYTMLPKPERKAAAAPVIERPATIEESTPVTTPNLYQVFANIRSGATIVRSGDTGEAANAKTTAERVWQVDHAERAAGNTVASYTVKLFAGDYRETITTNDMHDVLTIIDECEAGIIVATEYVEPREVIAAAPAIEVEYRASAIVREAGGELHNYDDTGGVKKGAAFVKALADLIERCAQHARVIHHFEVTYWTAVPTAHGEEVAKHTVIKADADAVRALVMELEHIEEVTPVLPEGCVNCGECNTTYDPAHADCCPVCLANGRVVFEVGSEDEASEPIEGMPRELCAKCLGAGTSLDPATAGLTCPACEGSGYRPSGTAPLVKRIKYAAHTRDAAMLSALEAVYLRDGACEMELSQPMARVAKHNAGAYLTDEAINGDWALIIYLLGVWLDTFASVDGIASINLRISPADDWRLRALLNPHMIGLAHGRKSS